MRVIIDNKTELKLADALILLQLAIEPGKISNDGKQHCYLTKMQFSNEVYLVESRLNKKSERFIIYKEH